MHPLDLAKLLLDVAPDETLLKSRINVHVLGLDSIVLAERRNGDLIRMYIATTPVLADNRLANLELGIHDHKYDLQLRRITGSIQNKRYMLRTDGISLKKYRFVPFSATEPPRAECIGTAAVRFWDSDDVGPSGVYMTHAALHTVRATKGSAWLVLESNRQKDKLSTLYTNRAVEFHGSHYLKFQCAQDVRDYAREFIERNA